MAEENAQTPVSTNTLDHFVSAREAQAALSAAPAAVAEGEPIPVPDEGGEVVVTPETPESTELVADEATVAAPDEGDEGQPQSGQGRLNKRFSDLTSEIKALKQQLADREAFTQEQVDFWKQRALERQERREDPGTPQPPADGLQRDTSGRPLRPLEEQYATTQDYHAALMRYEDALVDWRVERAIAVDRAQRAAVEAEGQVRQQYPDYEQVITTSRVRVNDDVAAALQASPQRHALFYHLAKHPDEAAALARVTGYGAALAIARLEVQLQATAAADASPPPASEPPVRTTQAPAPITPTRATTTRATRTYDDMSLDEFIGVRNKEATAAQRRY